MRFSGKHDPTKPWVSIREHSERALLTPSLKLHKLGVRNVPVHLLQIRRAESESQASSEGYVLIISVFLRVA